MGAINYGTSNYITLGYDLNWDASEFDCWDEMVEEMQYDIEDQYLQIEKLLENQSFYYFPVALKPGYYEGFFLDIENNFAVAFDGWEDRREAAKELTRLKSFLLECVDIGLVQVWPGWCTGYGSPEETRKAIAAAVKEMRDEIKTTPTWRQYARNQ